MTYVGYQAYALIGKETTWGTPVSATKDLGLIQNLTENSSNSLKRIFGLSSINTQNIVASKFDQNLSLEFAFQHGRIFEYIAGSVAHDAADTPDIKHTFTEANAVPSMTLEAGVDVTTDVVKKYAGVKVGAVTMALALEGVLNVRADLLAKTVADSSTASSSVVSTLENLPDYTGTVSTGANASESAVAEVQNAEVVIRTNPQKLWGLGDRIPKALEPFQRHYEFSFSAGFASVTEYERFISGSGLLAVPNATATPTLPSFILNVNNATALASGRRQMYINLRNASYESFGMPINVDGFIIQDFVGWARTLNSFYSYDTIVSGSW